jgi:predicted peptidase
VLDTAGPPAPHTKGSTCAALGYYAYVPPGYTTQSNLPLLVAFHGDGERGNGTSELTKLLDTGMMRAVKDDAWDPQHRFVVLAPQMDDRGGLGERTGASVKAFLDFAIANYAVDVKRVYLTGLSGGGAPIYNYMGDFQGAGVAATNIVCGWYSSQGKECLWKDVPVWYFHGDSDGVVPAGSHSTPSYNNLVACSPAPTKAPRYTMYKGVGHNAWSMTYDLSGMNATNYPIVSSPPGTTPYDVSLYDWFLQHAR